MNAVKNEKPGTPAASATKVTEIGKAQSKEQAKTQAKPEGSSVSQREAVFQQVTRVLSEDKVPFDSNTSVKVHMTDERLKRVYDGLVQGFQAKKITLKDSPGNQKKLAEISLLRNYSIGLTANWLRRDPRLNGKPANKN